jgi:hypothetical protein
MSSSDRQSTGHICEVATAVVQAMRELATVREDGKPRQIPYPPSLMGTAEEPDCLADFTVEEVEEATAFLVRLGIFTLPEQ